MDRSKRSSNRRQTEVRRRRNERQRSLDWRQTKARRRHIEQQQKARAKREEQRAKDLPFYQKSLMIVGTSLCFIMISISMNIRDTTFRSDLIYQMALIPAGEFQMGSNDGDNDEKPVHKVYLDSFYIDKYEVTNAQYARFLNDYGKDTDNAGHVFIDFDDEHCLIEKSGDGYHPKLGYENHPVIEVTWYGAVAYAEFYGKRLPTEAEWEKAARGGLRDKRFFWGDEIDPTKANFDLEGSRNWSIEDMLRYLKPVGTFPANGYGLHDMVGNVWEWCADLYEINYHSDKLLQKPDALQNSEYRICRGGSWIDGPFNVRTANRSRMEPTSTVYSLGFRCCVSSLSSLSQKFFS